MPYATFKSLGEENGKVDVRDVECFHAMLVLFVAIALQAAVLVLAASPINKQHRSGRCDVGTHCHELLCCWRRREAAPELIL